MRKSRSFYVAVLIIGICCMAASFFFRDESVKSISGVLIGVGAGLVGMSVSGLGMKHTEHKHPEIKKQAEIDYKDERNIMIRNRAKARAGDITQWLIMVIAYITILVSAPLWVTLAVIAVFVVHNVIGLYLIGKYQREM